MIGMRCKPCSAIRQQFQGRNRRRAADSRETQPWLWRFRKQVSPSGLTRGPLSTRPKRPMVLGSSPRTVWWLNVAREQPKSERLHDHSNDDDDDDDEGDFVDGAIESVRAGILVVLELAQQPAIPAMHA